MQKTLNSEFSSNCGHRRSFNSVNLPIIRYRILKEKSPSIHKMLEDFNHKVVINLLNHNTERLRCAIFMGELQLIQTGSDTGHVQ